LSSFVRGGERIWDQSGLIQRTITPLLTERGTHNFWIKDMDPVPFFVQVSDSVKRYVDDSKREIDSWEEGESVRKLEFQH
jgi:hypothetical protein